MVVITLRNDGLSEDQRWRNFEMSYFDLREVLFDSRRGARILTIQDLTPIFSLAWRSFASLLPAVQEAQRRNFPLLGPFPSINEQPPLRYLDWLEQLLSGPAIRPRRPPTVPARDAVLRRWRATWRLVRGQVGAGKSDSELLKWLHATHPELEPSVKTLRAIVRAGQAGELD